ncbi:hypothetical protein BDQ17DRAFT_1549062 [Cyathus striatus]|nr:hypothetical protein BDQ17DRAFT_1549062 [Cyathus striatus]
MLSLSLHTFCFLSLLTTDDPRQEYFYYKSNSILVTMSLPIAPKDISEHPMKGSVIDPVDKAKKDADVDRKLSPEGKKLIQDTRKESPPTAIKHLRTLLSLILTNSEVRKLLKDFSLIGRDLLSRSLSKAAGGLAPDAERLARVDESVPNDPFVTEGGRIAGKDETPVLEARVPGTDAHIKQHPKEEGVLSHGGEERPLGDMHDEASRRAQELREEAIIRKEEGRERAAQEIDDTEDMGDAKEKGRGVMDRVRDMRDNIRDLIPQQHKERANEHTERAKKFLSEKYFSEERRDQFIFRGKKNAKNTKTTNPPSADSSHSLKHAPHTPRTQAPTPPRTPRNTLSRTRSSILL